LGLLSFKYPKLGITSNLTLPQMPKYQGFNCWARDVCSKFCNQNSYHMINLLTHSIVPSFQKRSRNLLFLIVTLSSILTPIKIHAQLDSIHWLPPLTATNIGQAINVQSIYISTPETDPFTIEIRKGNDDLIFSALVSNDLPIRFDLPEGFNDVILPHENVGVVNTDKGYVITGPKQFYANYRGRNSSQAGSLTCKGRAAEGKKFFWMGMPNYGSYGNLNAVAGIMATEDGTTVMVSGYDPDCVFRSGLDPDSLSSDTIHISLDRGESFVLEAKNSESIANEIGWMGAKIESDKNIVVNMGNLLGGVVPDYFGRDIGFDQSVPIEYCGREYITIRGNGTDASELVLICAIEDGTDIYVNGSLTPEASLNEGEIHIFDGAYYSVNNNMYINASKDISLFQVMAGGIVENTTGLNIIPPLSCALPEEVNLIPSIEKIELFTYTGGATILTKSGASVLINGVPPLPSPLPVEGTSEWVTYRVNGLLGDIHFTSTEPMAVGLFGQNGNAGYAGYFSGFGSKPVINATYGNCAPGMILEEIGNFDSYQWLHNNVEVIGAINKEYVLDYPGYYSVVSAIESCIDTSNQIYIPPCPTEGGISKDIGSIIESSPNVFDITYKLTVENFGVNKMFYTQVTDTLTYPPCTELAILTAPYIVSGGTILSPGSVNPEFSPGIDNRLLLGMDTLSAGASDTIVYTIRYDLSETACQGTFSNQVFLSGTGIGPNNGEGETYYHDNSENGNDPDPDENNSPDEESETILCLPIIDETTIIYSYDIYLTSDTEETPLIDGWIGGEFSAEDGLIIDPTSGEINPGSSSTGLYNIIYSFGEIPCTGSTSFNIQILPDWDNDGIDDFVDLDDDNDGIPDLDEGDGDTDGDGIPDSLDLDSDNDGIPDIVEAGGTDTDGDGLVDDFNDTDGDGLDDFIASDPLDNPDSDGDGIPDTHDLDSDNDGTPDVVEAGGTDEDGDGLLDDVTDVDGDGFADVVDTDDNTIPGTGDGGTPLTNPDTDGDGLLDFIDLDSDNDGIPDVIENGGTDANGDGVIDEFVDVDGDGLADIVDPTEGGIILPGGDNDMDGIPNALDLDSDNDGIPDIIEGGGFDENGDGTIDDLADTDGDGFGDVVDTDNGGVALEIPNTDGTGGPDYLDIDADRDGIPDNIEAQSSGGYNEPAGTDSDGDGIDDTYDIDSGGTPVGSYDHDADGTPDFQDLDADNDGESDLIEGHDLDGDGVPDTIPVGTDADADGLDDAFDTIDLMPETTFTNAGNGTSEPLTDGVFADSDTPGIGDLDFRENDTDGDGIDDSVDLDDDNDGIPDSIEGNVDSDGDGIIDSLDLDSDNDGIPDIIEAGGTDENGDGRVDDLNEDGTLINDTDNDGLDDLYDSDNGGEDIPNPDTDGDGHSDFQDIDSDNDGIYDRVEDGGVDEDNDGLVDDWADEDGDGIPDYADVNSTGGSDSNGDGIDDAVQTENDTDGDGIGDEFDQDADGDGWDDDDATDGSEDTDGDGVEDRLDLDSDNDGTPDIIEDGGTDENGDGVIDDFNDEDGDGADDDDMTDGLDDFDGDGIPDHEDLDSDNDGITDTEENGLPDEDGDGVIDDFNDEDGDGWDDDNQTTDPIDTDGDGQPDHTDLDSDDDGIDDIIEGGGNDEDGDGTIDGFEDENGDGLDDDGGVDPPDTDGDGIDDFQDTDSDNDGVLDEEENDPDGDGNGPDDTDNDGIPDYQDEDDDNDLIPTEDESDKNEAGNYTDCDDDGIPDYLDPDICNIIIPTGFSPNNDQTNDYFVIKGIENNPNVSITIFNRWGSKVYESNSYQNDWDGTNQFGLTMGNKNLPDGTYFYLIDLGEGSEVIRNYVQIQR
jgi:gliding motility-associated-like protein